MNRRSILSLSCVVVLCALFGAGPAIGAPATATPPLATPAGSPVASPAAAEIPETPLGQQLAWVLGVLNGGAATLTPADMESHFAPDFLAAVPVDQAITTTQQLATTLGPFVFTGFLQPPTATEAVGAIVSRSGERFALSIAVEPNAPYRIVGLLIEPAPENAATPVPLASWDDLDGRLQALAPEVSFLAAEVGDGSCQPVHAIAPTRQLAIGSTFKLFVLGTLAHQVERGAATWDEELAIRDDRKSLPSGRMQDEPVGTTHTLRAFAEQMIAISDNTAADHLIWRLGREQVEAFQGEMGHAAPARNTPFLTSREFFAFKLGLAPERVDAYLAASVAEKRRLLDREVGPIKATLADAAGWTAPRRVDTIEWFASAADLCRAMVALKELSTRPGLEPVRDILALNPGVPFDANTWTYVGYKGGSEPGVLNLTWLLQRADGRWFVLTASLNNPTQPIDDNAAIALLAEGAPLLGTAP